MLFEAEQRDQDLLGVLAARAAAADPPVADYTTTLVTGVHQHGARIDEVLGATVEGWTLDRLPAVDRAVLRLAVFELLFAPDVPDAVCIDEAVALARSLSTEDSPRFVNGVLGQVARGSRDAVPAAAGQPATGPQPAPPVELPVAPQTVAARPGTGPTA